MLFINHNGVMEEILVDLLCEFKLIHQLNLHMSNAIVPVQKNILYLFLDNAHLF